MRPKCRKRDEVVSFKFVVNSMGPKTPEDDDDKSANEPTEGGLVCLRGQQKK